MPKLTKAIIDQNKPKTDNYYVWDNEIKGFGCRILKGGKKTYVFFYYAPGQKKKAYIKIGVHGNITVDEARTKAKGLASLVAHGTDPKEVKKEEEVEEKQSILFGEFFNIFRDKYILTAYKDKGYRNMIFSRTHILPAFSHKKLAEITPRDIRLFLDSLIHLQPTANRCLALLSVLFKKAEDWEYLPARNNPCVGAIKYKENKKQRFLSRGELERLENSLQEQEKEYPVSYYSVQAIRLALYTGCRKSNILNLKWADVHLKERYLHLPDTKTGESACPLNPKAFNLLTAIKRKEGHLYVFPGIIPDKPLTRIEVTFYHVLKRAGIKGFRIHDLRHSFASFSLAQGVDLYTVSKLLGHKHIATTTRYAHLDLRHLKEATNKMSEVFG